MTVDTKAPIARYTGNGVLTAFAWDWKMLDTSSIHVLLDNDNTTAWTENGQNVVFDVAPDEGAEIIIYRRTKVYMPENYSKFRRFASSKTELSVDRAIMIAQERRGDAKHGEPPNGIVGGANLSTTKAEFNLTVNSERGKDAVLEMWSDGEPDTPGTPTEPPVVDPPDASILWDGGTLLSRSIASAGEGSSGAETTLIFFMEFDDGGDTDKCNARWMDNNVYRYDGAEWLNVEPNDGDYWFRITVIVPDPENDVVVTSNTVYKPNGVAFPIEAREIVGKKWGPWIQLTSYSSSPPYTATAEITVEICKDSGGLPDENWATRTVILEAIYNV